MGGIGQMIGGKNAQSKLSIRDLLEMRKWRNREAAQGRTYSDAEAVQAWTNMMAQRQGAR